MDMRNQIVVYKASDGNELAVKTDGETVWMTIEQMVKLLGRDRTVLIRHVNNAIKEGELRRDINVQNLHNNHTGRGRPAPCRVDIISKISGVSYADAVTRAVPKTIDGIPVRIISLEDLIANKKASGRAKDLADVEVLEGCRK